MVKTEYDKEMRCWFAWLQPEQGTRECLSLGRTREEALLDLGKNIVLENLSQDSKIQP